VRPVVVVVIDPGAEFGLGVGQAGETVVISQEFQAHRLMPALNLPSRGGGAGAGQPGGDAVFAADPLEQHLAGPRLDESARELLAIVGQHFIRHPEPGQ
jgi:hypothetical protein